MNDYEWSLNVYGRQFDMVEKTVKDLKFLRDDERKTNTKAFSQVTKMEVRNE